MKTILGCLLSFLALAGCVSAPAPAPAPTAPAPAPTQGVAPKELKLVQVKENADGTFELVFHNGRTRTWKGWGFVPTLGTIFYECQEGIKPKGCDE